MSFLFMELMKNQILYTFHIINLQNIGLPSRTFSTFPDKILIINGFSITKSGKSFTLTGSSNTSLAPDNVYIKGVIRLTYTPNTNPINYVDFDYWYNPTNL